MTSDAQCHATDHRPLCHRPNIAPPQLPPPPSDQPTTLTDHPHAPPTGTAEAQIVHEKCRASANEYMSNATLSFNDVTPKAEDHPEAMKAWFTEQNLSWTANKHLKCLNAQGKSVPATYRQNSLYYDPILSEFKKHMLFRYDSLSLLTSRSRYYYSLVEPGSPAHRVLAGSQARRVAGSQG